MLKQPELERLPVQVKIFFFFKCMRGLVQRMKPFLTLIVCLLGVFLLPACHLKSSYEKNAAARVAYLQDKKTSPAKIDVEGVYYSPEWGIALLKQSPGGKLSGYFADYGSVEGIVSGKNAYFTIVDSGWAEYTFELTQPRSDRLKGLYSAHLPFDMADQTEIVLEKIRR